MINTTQRGKYQDFKDAIDGGTAVSAEVVTDILPAGALLIETFGFALGEFNRTRGEDDIGSKSAAGF